MKVMLKFGPRPLTLLVITWTKWHWSKKSKQLRKTFSRKPEIKLKPQSKKFIFLGHKCELRKYRFWNKETSKIYYSIDVDFNETKPINQKQKEVSVLAWTKITMFKVPMMFIFINKLLMRQFPTNKIGSYATEHSSMLLLWQVCSVHNRKNTVDVFRDSLKPRRSKVARSCAGRMQTRQDKESYVLCLHPKISV